MAVKRLYSIRETFFDAGVVANNYRLFFYVAGSSTKQNTYNSSTGANANSNPLTLNSSGQSNSEIWLTTGVNYKVVLALPGSDDPPNSPVWSEDVVTGVNDASLTLDEWVSGPVPTFVSATQFTLVGDQTSTFQVNRRIKASVTAGTVYGSITVSAFTTLTTVTVVLDSGSLDSGLSAIFYSLLSATNQSFPATIATLAKANVFTADQTISKAIPRSIVNDAVGGASGAPSFALQEAGVSKWAITSDGANADRIVFSNAAGGQFTWTQANPTSMAQGVVPLARMQRAYAESTGTGTTLTVSLGTVVAGDIVYLSANGDVTLNAAAAGEIIYQLGVSGSATVTNCGSGAMPSIGVTTTAATSGSYFFASTVILKVTVGGTLTVGITGRTDLVAVVSSNNVRVAAECLIGT